MHINNVGALQVNVLASGSVVESKNKQPMQRKWSEVLLHADNWQFYHNPSSHTLRSSNTTIHNASLATKETLDTAPISLPHQATI